jgi:hypothetical protein
MYASEGCNKSVYEHVICGAYDKKFTIIKQEKHMFCLPNPDSPV